MTYFPRIYILGDVLRVLADISRAQCALRAYLGLFLRSCIYKCTGSLSLMYSSAHLWAERPALVLVRYGAVFILACRFVPCRYCAGYGGARVRLIHTAPCRVWRARVRPHLIQITAGPARRRAAGRLQPSRRPTSDEPPRRPRVRQQSAAGGSLCRSDCSCHTHAYCPPGDCPPYDDPSSYCPLSDHPSSVS